MGGSGQLGVQGLDHFGLFFGDLDDADSVWLLNDLRTGLRVVAEFLTRLGAAVARERFTGKRGSAVPAFGDGIACDLRDDDVCAGCVGGLGSCCRLFTLAVLRERLAREHDGLRSWAVGLGGLAVGGGAVYAVQGGPGGEATGDARALVAIAATAATVSAVVAIAVVTPTTVASVSAISAAGVLLPGPGPGAGLGDRV